jgi:hypothetical protein
MMHTFLNWLVGPCGYSNLTWICNTITFCGLGWCSGNLMARVKQIESDIYEEVPADATA